MPSPPEDHKIEPKDVEYLSFAGGGGKGGAYLGLMAAATHEWIDLLEQVTINGQKDWVLDGNQIKGIAGASAGAITAALASSGMSLGQFQDLLLGESELGTLGKFFDPADTRWSYRPTVSLDDIEPIERDGTRLLGTTRYNRSGDGRWVNLIENSMGPALKGLVKWKKSSGGQITEQLDTNARAYSANLWYDKGLFSGCYARTKLSEWLVANVDYDGVDLDEGKEVTFEQHRAKNGLPDLKLTGANLRTGELGYFSADTVPPMKVADALRISMSIPFAFKPLEIGADVTSDRRIPDEFEGVWVDGGLRNNHPIHAFDREDELLNENVLGLKLTDVTDGAPMKSIDDYGLVEMLGASLDTIQESSGTGQARTPQEQGQTLHVPLGGLETLELQPPREKLKIATKSAAIATFNYFEDFFPREISEAEVITLLEDTLPKLKPWENVKTEVELNI